MLRTVDSSDHGRRRARLAGDWRGFFTHKNGAGAGMALLIFIGIFVYRAWNRFGGIPIVVPAGIFLYFTHAKSPINLLPVVLLLSYVIPRVRSARDVLALVLGVPIADQSPDRRLGHVRTDRESGRHR